MIRILLFLLFCNLTCLAQTVKYSYDHVGNRVQRKLDISNPSTQRSSNIEAEKNGLEKANKLGMSVFPNPSSDKVNLKIANAPDATQATLLLLDAGGRELYSKNMDQGIDEIDMSEFKPGVYFVKVIVGKEILFYKVMKL